MSLLDTLRLGVAVSALICCAALTLLVIRTFNAGRRETYARPSGTRAAGIIYAFGRGMLPWEKESASHHLLTYIGGTLYHLGIFAALAVLVALCSRYRVPPAPLLGLRSLLLLGLVAGSGLLLKRILLPPMRFISGPDDYVANTVVDLFLLLALAATFTEGAQVPFLALAAGIFLYVPLGKIRHCAFFFYARLLYGDFFGRRHVLPHPSRRG